MDAQRKGAGVLDGLNRAMDHVEEHLDGEIDPAVLARIAVTSEYHFRRMFPALAGMPLAEYVRRRRLTVAGAEVLTGGRTLLDIAVRYGWSSGEAFARAFRAMHGIGPGEARRTGAALTSQQRLSFRLVVEGKSTMQYRIVEKPEFRVVGKRVRVPLVYEGVNPGIAEFIRSLPPETVGRIARMSDQDPEGLVSVTETLSPGREEGSDVDYYHAVVTGAEPPEDLDVREVPAGTWAVFENEGPFPEALQHLWRDVYTEWFPSNPYESRPGPEILRTRPTPDLSESVSQLWIPVTRTGTGSGTGTKG